MRRRSEDVAQAEAGAVGRPGGGGAFRSVVGWLQGTLTGVLAEVLILLTLLPFLPLIYLSWRGFREDVAGLEQEIGSANRHIAMLAAGSLETRLRLVANEARVAGAATRVGLPEAVDGVWWERVGLDGEVLASTVATGRVGGPSGYQELIDRLEPGGSLLSGVGRWIPEAPPTAISLLRPAQAQVVLAGVLDPVALHARLQAISGDELDRHLYVVDAAGELLFYSDLSLSRQGADLRSNPPIRELLAGREGPLSYLSQVSGKQRLGFVQRLEGIGWGVVVSADDGERLLAVRDRYLAVGWSIAFALVVAALILLWTSRRLGAPLVDIVRALQAPERLAHAPLRVRQATRTVREYDQLVQAFDELGAEVAEVERELVAAGRSALLGQLASGLAHEMGTPLNVISGNAQYLLRKTGPAEASRRVLEQIVDQSRRIADMIRRLLDLSRPSKVRLVPVDPVTLVRQALEVLPAVSREIEVRTELEPDLPRVLADPKLLEHALLNLLVNACQAMPSGGVLTLRVALEPDGREPGPGSRPQVAIEVRDTGCGIGETELEHILEPFYTTKAQGKGTGLGLAIVDRIVRQHRGRLWVASCTGHGASFTIELAAHEPPRATAAAEGREPGAGQDTEP